MTKTRKRVLIITLALLLIPALVTIGCSGGDQSPSVATIGQPAPDFTLLDLDGESVSLSNLKGSPVVINFWNTGCTYCIQEMPHLQAVYEENRDNGLVLFTINIGQNASTVDDFLNTHNFALPVLLDSDGAVAQHYGISGIPTTFFIDRDGILQAKVIGAFPTKAAIESRLSEIMS